MGKMTKTNEKPGFMIFYEDWEIPLQLMSKEEFAELFEASFSYSRDGVLPEGEHSKMFDVFFTNMKCKLERDDERYQNAVEQRRLAGKRSAEKRLNNIDAQDALTTVNECQRPLTTVDDRQPTPTPTASSSSISTPNTTPTASPVSTQRQPQQQRLPQEQPQPQYNPETGCYEIPAPEEPPGTIKFSEDMLPF